MQRLMTTAVPPTPRPDPPPAPAPDTHRRDLITSLALGALAGGGAVLLIAALLVMAGR